MEIVLLVSNKKINKIILNVKILYIYIGEIYLCVKRNVFFNSISKI